MWTCISPSCTEPTEKTARFKACSKCRSRSDLAESLLEAAQYDRRVLIERGVPNPREIEIAVLGNDSPEASVPGEIIPGADFYSYDAKYILDNSRPVIPAALSETQV